MVIRQKLKAIWLKILCSCIFLMTIPCFSASEDKNLQSRALDGQIEFFYLNHNPQTILNIIKETAILKEFDCRYCFFSALFKTYPKQALQWIKDSQVKLEDHNPLILALWAGGLQSEAIYRAQKADWPAKNLLELTNHPKPALEFSPEQSGYLPCMSCYFFVTGDTRYIDKIIDVLALTPEKIRPSFNLKELKEDAKFHLMLLIYHHERVYQLCLEESLSRSGEAGHLLKELIEQHKALVKKGAFQEHNDMLNGDILITDSPSFEEEWKTLPVDSGPIGKSVSSISYPKESKQIKIIPLFSGFALDKELNGHVTYDIDIYDPDGKKVGCIQGKLGLQRKIPSRFLVQAAEDLIELKFEAVKSKKEAPKNMDCLIAKTGSYTIQGIIRDHIGNTELKISKILEVLPPKN